MPIGHALVSGGHFIEIIPPTEKRKEKKGKGRYSSAKCVVQGNTMIQRVQKKDYILLSRL